MKIKIEDGECTMLTNILSRPGEQKFIPRACHFDEANNQGRVHVSVQNTLYTISRRLTKSMAPNQVVADLPQHTIHFNDHPQSGNISLKECHVLANHLHETRCLRRLAQSQRLMSKETRTSRPALARRVPQIVHLEPLNRLSAREELVGAQCGKN